MSASERTFRLDVDDSRDEVGGVRQPVSLFVHQWSPPGPPKAIVLISHGMAEHGARYGRFAQRLCAAGYVVYASDHRGHGRSVSKPEDLGYFGDGAGFEGVIADQEKLRLRALQDHPGLPFFVFAHSMGSFVMRRYAIQHGDKLAGLVLSGTAGGQVPLVKIGRNVAKVERLRLGKRGKSQLLHQLSFGDYNRKFKPLRTESDWLSRDPAEVDKYVADPLCGWVLSTQGWVEVMTTIIEMQDEAAVSRMPKALPIYVFSGTEDPVGRNTSGVQDTLNLFKRAGLTNVESKLYAGGRHEMLNEINRDDVERDVVAYLDRTLAALEPAQSA
jgi:alpha-beta hydrolase superfamily lysophospholipase